MKRAFVDAFYWIAITDPHDNWHQRAVEQSEKLGNVRLVTTESVLIEYVNFFSRYSASLRRAVVESVHDILDDDTIEVLPQTRTALLAGMSLHASRPDKNYSLTDCISMQVMREEGIFEVLTHDAHFAQEGFITLLR